MYQRYLYFHLLILLSAVMACQKPEETRQQVFTRDDAAIEVGKDVEILYSDSAVVRVRIKTAVLLNITDRSNPRQEFPNGVEVDFLDPDGTVASKLTAKTAYRYMEKGLVIARDSVVLSTLKEEKLETEELIWDEQSRKIRTDKFVKMTKPDEVIYGFGLEAEQDFSYWRILVPKGRIKAEQINESID